MRAEAGPHPDILDEEGGGYRRMPNLRPELHRRDADSSPDQRQGRARTNPSEAQLDAVRIQRAWQATKSGLRRLLPGNTERAWKEELIPDPAAVEGLQDEAC